MLLSSCALRAAGCEQLLELLNIKLLKVWMLQACVEFGVPDLRQAGQCSLLKKHCEDKEKWFRHVHQLQSTLDDILEKIVGPRLCCSAISMNQRWIEFFGTLNVRLVFSWTEQKKRSRHVLNVVSACYNDSSFVCTSPLAVTTVVGFQDLRRVSSSSELKTFVAQHMH